MTAAHLAFNASVPGIFTYSHKIGDGLRAGTNTITAWFDSTDSRNYKSVVVTTDLTVTPDRLFKVYFCPYPDYPTRLGNYRYEHHDRVFNAYRSCWHFEDQHRLSD